MTEDQLREIGALNANMGHVLEAIADMKKQLNVVVELVGKHNALADRVALLEKAVSDLVSGQRPSAQWGRLLPVLSGILAIAALIGLFVKLAQWLPPVAGH